ncbi:hypothetical protein DUI87_14819 [Hirundo rustica rustica]|uniref:Uncharacterized protein n=1 Tax=Hirundo rustica rustica TaxID=333673 RepID=A0A3M0K5X1_HIRRU|nr:hypothetical protein DUI87_14819 [Hirundo rustica rustica]
MQLLPGFSQDTQLTHTSQQVAATEFRVKVRVPDHSKLHDCHPPVPIYFTSSPSPLSHHTEGPAELGAYTKKPQQITKHDSTLQSSCEAQHCEER